MVSMRIAPKWWRRRQEKNRRTARSYVNEVCDPGRFIEYGAFAVAAQRGRRSMEDLIRRTPADGLIAGIGSVNGSMFGDDKARCMIMVYDYTVLAGTQGFFNHKKKDRMLRIAYEQRLPLVFFAEGGGGRPGRRRCGWGCGFRIGFIYLRLVCEFKWQGPLARYCNGLLLCG